MAETFGIDTSFIKAYDGMVVTESNINEYDRFNNLKASVDRTKAKDFFEKTEGKALSLWEVNRKIDLFLRDYLLEEDFDI